MSSVHGPLNGVAASLERYFAVPVGINAYIACREIHGFDFHRDDHEVFVIQVSGTKRFLHENQGQLGRRYGAGAYFGASTHRR